MIIFVCKFLSFDKQTSQFLYFFAKLAEKYNHAYTVSRGFFVEAQNLAEKYNHTHTN